MKELQELTKLIEEEIKMMLFLEPISDCDTPTNLFGNGR